MSNGERESRHERRWWRCFSIVELLRDIRQGNAMVLRDVTEQKSILKRIETALGGLARRLDALAQQEAQIMAIDQDILDAVAAETTLVGSNTVLLQQLKALATPQDLSKLNEALTKLIANNTALAQAQVDNTPAAAIPVDQPPA